MLLKRIFIKSFETTRINKKALVLIIFLFFYYSLNAQVPNTFSPGEIVSSSKVNQNFEHLDNKTNPSYDLMLVYKTRNTYDGNLGGRSGADEKCINDPIMFFVKKIKYNCNSIRAFISIDENDEMADVGTKYNFPIDLQVILTNGFHTGKNLSSLVNDRQSINVQKYAFLVNDHTTPYWTGSYSNGRVKGNDSTSKNVKNCNNFTSNKEYHIGFVGNTGIAFHDTSQQCYLKAFLLCLCY